MLRKTLSAAVLLSIASFAIAQAPAPTTAPVATQPPAPKPITLHLEATSPEEAFAELSSQSGIQIRPIQPGLWAKADPVEISVDNGKFWPVFLDMCDQANVRFNLNFSGTDRKTVHLFPANQGIPSLKKYPHSEAAGSFLVLTSGYRNYSINYNNPVQSPAGLGLQAALLLDPTIQSGGARIIVSEALDENGKSLAAQQSQGYLQGNDPGPIQHAHIPLAYPENAGRKLASLRCELVIKTITQSQTLSIDSPADAQPQTLALSSMTAEIRSTKLAGSAIEVEAAIQLKAPTRGEEFQGIFGLFYAVQLIDASGNSYLLQEMMPRPTSPTLITARLRFGSRVYGNPVNKPAKLTWTLPTETREARLPFEFKDIPLP